MPYYRWIGWLASLGSIAVTLIACGAPSGTPIAAQLATSIVPTQAAAPPTEAPTRSPTATPAPTCVAAWTQSYRDGSPAVEAQIQQLLAAEKISASVHSSIYGENDGYGMFHGASLDVEVTAQVKNLTNHDALAALAAQIDAIVQQVHVQTKVVPKLGRRQVIFVANNATCRWDTERQAC